MTKRGTHAEFLIHGYRDALRNLYHETWESEADGALVGLVITSPHWLKIHVLIKGQIWYLRS